MLASLASWRGEGGQDYRLDTGLWCNRHLKNLFVQPYALLLLILNGTFMQTFDLKPIASHWNMGTSGQYSRDCSQGPSLEWQPAAWHPGMFLSSIPDRQLLYLGG